MQILFSVLMLSALGASSASSGEIISFGDNSFVAMPSAAVWSDFSGWVAETYERSPAAVLGGAVLIIVLPLAILAFLLRRRTEDPAVPIEEARTQVRRGPKVQAAALGRDGVRTGHIPLRPLQAWIEVVAAGDGQGEAQDKKYSLAQTLLRIGREADNDICLLDKTVHRYHAAIRRTEDAEFVITDLSSSGGNGVVLNGRAVSEARLASGDLIQLGNAQLKFSAGARG